MAPNSQFGAFIMGTDKNLHNVMNEVSLRLDRGVAICQPEKPKALDELQAFITLDPLLADLHKQYQDARQNRVQAIKEYGGADGMCDMAAILEDSAWCAMQTRYMELRAQRSMMARAQQIMIESRLEEERAMREEKEKDARQALEQMQLFARMRGPKEESAVGYWMAIMMMYGNHGTFFRNYQPSYAFNRLAA